MVSWPFSLSHLRLCVTRHPKNDVSLSTESKNIVSPPSPPHSLLLRYAGMLLGITNTFGTIPGALAPIVMGYLTRDVSPEFVADQTNSYLLSIDAAHLHI